MTGEYDFANQVAVRNQYYGNEYGYHLLTPLLFDSSSLPSGAVQALVVDRGWIPADGNSTSSLPEQAWRKYDEVGTVNVSGQIRLGQTKPALGGVADVLPANGSKLEIWNNADLTQIAKQMPYPVLPVYLQAQARPKRHAATDPIPA